MTATPQVSADGAGLSPASVAAYLSTTGWRLVQDSSSWQSWMYGDVPTSDHILQLPTDPAYADYEFNLTRALRKLELLNGWDAQQLSTQVLGARSDILYIRAAQYSSDGSIPVREAQQLLDGAVSMVTAAARWTKNPRGNFGGRLPDDVKSFVDDDLRMGHTQRGSFVITILTRLDEQESPTATAADPTHISTPSTGHAVLPDGYIPPFQRRVMSSLASGLSYVRSATDTALASQAGVFAVDLDDAVGHGVNAQLCQALGEMTDQSGVSSLDLSFSWAAAEPSPPPQVERIVFDRPATPILRDMRERLSPSPPAERDVTVVGHVTRLERGQDAEEGTVTVEGFVAETREQRAVRIPLDGERYTRAVQAHDGRGWVEASGRLVRDGNAYYLRGKVALRRVTISELPQD